MINSFAMMHAGSQPARNGHQFIARGNVPGNNAHRTVVIFGIFTRAGTVEAASVRYRGTEQEDKM